MAKDQRKKLKTVLKMTTFSNVKIGAYSSFFYCGKPDTKLVQKVSEEKREELIGAMNRVLLELWNLKDDLRNEVRKNTLTSAKFDTFNTSSSSSHNSYFTFIKSYHSSV